MFMCLLKPEARKQSPGEQCGFKRRTAELDQRAVQQKERFQGRRVGSTTAKMHKEIRNKLKNNKMPILDKRLDTRDTAKKGRHKHSGNRSLIIRPQTERRGKQLKTHKIRASY